MRPLYFRLILGIVFIGLHDFQLRHHEHPVCAAVYLPWRLLPVFRLFHLEEGQRESGVIGMSGTALLSLNNLSVWYTAAIPYSPASRWIWGSMKLSG